MKEWNRFDKVLTKSIGGQEYYLDVQELLCKKYDTILTDYETKREKWLRRLKMVNQTNIDKGLKVFNDGVENFTKELTAFGDAFGKDQKGE